MYGARRHGERSTSRMYVLVCFLDLVSSRLLVPLDACRRVFLLQACPPSFANSKDLFVPIAKVAHSFTEETLRHAAGKSFWISFATPSREVLHGTSDSPRILFTFGVVHNATCVYWLFDRCSILPGMLDMVNLSLRLRAIVCAPSQMSVSSLNVSSLSPVSGVLSYVSNALRLQNDNFTGRRVYSPSSEGSVS